LNDTPDSAIPIASALTALYDRFEEKLGEGDYIADLTRQSFQPGGTQNLLTAIAEAENEELRPLAVVIGWLRGPAVDRMLVRLLGEPSVRDEVLTALTHHGEGVISLLIDQIQSEDIETRRAAITALGRLGYRQATAALTKVLEKDPSMRVEAAKALARIGDESALDPSLRMIGDSDSAARHAVADDRRQLRRRTCRSGSNPSCNTMIRSFANQRQRLQATLVIATVRNCCSSVVTTRMNAFAGRQLSTWPFSKTTALRMCLRKNSGQTLL
jgi:HEAT repeat protein